MEHVSDAERINAAVAEAAEQQRAIDTDTARLIASQVHDGQWSAYYSFSSAGHLDRERLMQSIERDLADEKLEDDAKRWIGALATYVAEQEAEAEPDHPRIYVADLAAYNNGILHGTWMRADREADEVLDDIAGMLANSPIAGAEEFAIHDHDGFEGVQIGEYDSIERVTTIARLVAEHGRTFADWLSYTGDLDHAAESYEDAFVGTFDNEGELLEHLLDELCIEQMMDGLPVPESLRSYVKFDGEGFLQDLQFGGELYVAEGECGSVTAYWTR